MLCRSTVEGGDNKTIGITSFFAEETSIYRSPYIFFSLKNMNIIFHGMKCFNRMSITHISIRIAKNHSKNTTDYDDSPSRKREHKSSYTHKYHECWESWSWHRYNIPNYITHTESQKKPTSVDYIFFSMFRNIHKRLMIIPISAPIWFKFREK